jgi:outer membrane protein assembly factor BamB
VYFGAWDAFTRKFNKYTGELIWKHHLGGSSDSGSPIGYGERLYLPVGGGKFRCLDANTAEILWTPKLDPVSFNVTPAYYHEKGIVYISTLEGVGMGGIPVRAKTYGVDSENGELIWEFTGGGGLTGAVVGANDRVYFGSTVSPYFFCVDAEGNGDGTTTLHWAVRLGAKTEESVPALYNGKAYVLNSGGYLYCIK